MPQSGDILVISVPFKIKWDQLHGTLLEDPLTGEYYLPDSERAFSILKANFNHAINTKLESLSRAEAFWRERFKGL